MHHHSLFDVYFIDPNAFLNINLFYLIIATLHMYYNFCYVPLELCALGTQQGLDGGEGQGWQSFQATVRAPQQPGQALRSQGASSTRWPLGS